jgi:hypothetical protein
MSGSIPPLPQYARDNITFTFIIIIIIIIIITDYAVLLPVPASNVVYFDTNIIIEYCL